MFFGEFIFLGHSRHSGEDDSEETDADSHEDGAARDSAKNFRCELPAEDGRHQRAEGGGVTKRDGHTERHSEIAHGQAEGETAKSPKNTEGINPKEAAAGSFVKDAD